MHQAWLNDLSYLIVTISAGLLLVAITISYSNGDKHNTIADQKQPISNSLFSEVQIDPTRKSDAQTQTKPTLPESVQSSLQIAAPGQQTSPVETFLFKRSSPLQNLSREEP